MKMMQEAASSLKFAFALLVAASIAAAPFAVVIYFAAPSAVIGEVAVAVAVPLILFYLLMRYIVASASDGPETPTNRTHETAEHRHVELRGLAAVVAVVSYGLIVDALAFTASLPVYLLLDMNWAFSIGWRLAGLLVGTAVAITSAYLYVRAVYRLLSMKSEMGHALTSLIHSIVNGVVNLLAVYRVRPG